MARKKAAELRKAAQELSPIQAPAEPPMSAEERAASRLRLDKMLFDVRQRMRAAPRQAPIDRWRKILDNPYACYIAKEMAREAVAELEGKFNEVERIAIEAELQENARRLAKLMGAKQEKDERSGNTPQAL